MAVKVAKCKMISLRLSAEEYESLQTVYTTYGARTVSEFARLAMQRVISDSSGADGAIL